MAQKHPVFSLQLVFSKIFFKVKWDSGGCGLFDPGKVKLTWVQGTWSDVWMGESLASGWFLMDAATGGLVGPWIARAV